MEKTIYQGNCWNWSTFCKMDHNPDFKWTLWSTGWKGKNSIYWNLLEVFLEWGGLDCHQPIIKLYEKPSGTVWFQRSGNDETLEFFRWWRKPQLSEIQPFKNQHEPFFRGKLSMRWGPLSDQGWTPFVISMSLHRMSKTVGFRIWHEYVGSKWWF